MLDVRSEGVKISVAPANAAGSAAVRDGDVAGMDSPPPAPSFHTVLCIRGLDKVSEEDLGAALWGLFSALRTPTDSVHAKGPSRLVIAQPREECVTTTLIRSLHSLGLVSVLPPSPSAVVDAAASRAMLVDTNQVVAETVRVPAHDAVALERFLCFVCGTVDVKSPMASVATALGSQLNTFLSHDGSEYVFPLRTHLCVITRTAKLPPLLVNPRLYAELYELRRAASTMQSNTIAWLQSNIASVLKETLVLPAGEAPRPLRLVSIGCGDGDLELILLKALQAAIRASEWTGVHIVGLDTDLEAVAVFQRRLAAQQRDGHLDSNITVEPTNQTYPWTPGSQVPMGDVAIMSHVIHFMPDRRAAVQAALASLRPAGRLVIVQQDFRGVPHVQKLVLPTLTGGAAVLFAAEHLEDVMKDVSIQSLCASVHRNRVPAFMDLASLRDASRREHGVGLASFAIHVNLLEADPRITQLVFDTFLRHSVPSAEEGRKGGPFLPDGVSVFVATRQ